MTTDVAGTKLALYTGADAKRLKGIQLLKRADVPTVLLHSKAAPHSRTGPAGGEKRVASPNASLNMF